MVSFTGEEKAVFILLFRRPDEFYVKFIEHNESIILSKLTDCKIPAKNEVYKNAIYVIEHNSDFVLCEILEDLKYDEIFCQVLLCNSKISLKVDYRRLIYLNEEDIVNDKDIISLKLNDFLPIFPSNEWNFDLVLEMKNWLTYSKCIIQMKSLNVDPCDGRLPVELLQINDRSSINKKFMTNETVCNESDYFKAALDYEILKIFSLKKNPKIHYKISTPLFKQNPVPRPGIFLTKVLNVKAEPFVPLSNNNHKSTEHFSSISSNFHKDSSLQTPQLECVHVNDNTLPNHLICNDVSMIKNNQQKQCQTAYTPPFHDYESVFPEYGGINFLQLKNIQNPNLLPSKPTQLQGFPLLPLNICCENKTSSLSPMISDPAIIFAKPLKSNSDSSRESTINTKCTNGNVLNTPILITGNAFNISDIPLPIGPSNSNQRNARFDNSLIKNLISNEDLSPTSSTISLADDDNFSVKTSQSDIQKTQFATNDEIFDHLDLKSNETENKNPNSIQDQLISSVGQLSFGEFTEGISSQNYFRIPGFSNSHSYLNTPIFDQLSFGTCPKILIPSRNILGMCGSYPLRPILNDNLFIFQQGLMKNTCTPIISNIMVKNSQLGVQQKGPKSVSHEQNNSRFNHVLVNSSAHPQLENVSIHPVNLLFYGPPT